MSKLKIILIGPSESGKTLISNILAEMTDSDYLRYEPTEGVRILEIECPQKSDSIRKSNLEIELWDCAGSHRFQSCWPVIQLEVCGIIFVFNPQAPEFISELELLYDYFVAQHGLTDENCMIFINQRENSFDKDLTKTLPRRFNYIMKKALNAAGNPNDVKQQFSNFLDILLRKIKTL